MHRVGRDSVDELAALIDYDNPITNSKPVCYLFDLDTSSGPNLTTLSAGELQARDIVIAVLKSEHIKHMIYPACSQMVPPGSRNPITSLWQDVIGAYDNYDDRVDVRSLRNIQQVRAHPSTTVPPHY